MCKWIWSRQIRIIYSHELPQVQWFEWLWIVHSFMSLLSRHIFFHKNLNWWTSLWKYTDLDVMWFLMLYWTLILYVMHSIALHHILILCYHKAQYYYLYYNAMLLISMSPSDGALLTFILHIIAKISNLLFIR